MSSTAVGTTPDPPHLSSRWSTCEQFTADGCPTMQQLGGLEQEGMLTAPGATFTKFLCPRQRKSQVILFSPPLGEGQPRPQESACAETSASPSPSAPLPLPWPCRRTARAHEWCSRALKIFPPSAFPQELQPKAACCHLSVAGINYLRRAGSGTFLPSLALQDVDIRQVGPASPGWQHGGDKGGRETWPTRSAGTDKKHRKNGKRSGKEHVGAALRCLRAYRVPNARLDADGSLELRWNKDICVCVDLLR